MSRSSDDRSIAPLLETLEVVPRARLGFAIGAGIAALLFAVFVLGPAETDLPPAYFVALGFVLAVSLGGLLSAVFVGIRVVRLARE